MDADLNGALLGVPLGVHLEDITRLVGHSSTSTTELVYRKELRPVITEGAEDMGNLFAE